MGLAPCWGVSDQKRKMIQRGYPWSKKNSKCSNLDETCRTGRGHQKNKLGSVFASVLAPCWGLRDQKVEDFGEKKTPKVEDWKSILNKILRFEKKVHDSHKCMTVKSA